MIYLWQQFQDRQEEYFSQNKTFSNLRHKPYGRKLDSFEYNYQILEFIREGRTHDISITSSEVISKAIEIVPGFKEKSYDSLHHYFKRFREKHSHSIRKVTKISQNLPKNYLENLRNYLYDVTKNMIEKETYFKTHILANVDETPLVLEPIWGITLENNGAKTIKKRTFGKSKERISCILCIFPNGKKAPPMLLFKGVPESTLEKKLNKLP